MKIIIDSDEQTLTEHDASGVRVMPLYSKEAFSSISRQWVRVGWNQKYQYTFSWMGRPVIQLPEDLVRIQEVIFRIQPDKIVETGVAHGGSLIFYASLCKALGKGRVVGVDIEIRPNNREAIESHPLSGFVDLVEGSSTASETIRKVADFVSPGDRVLVILDSDHSKKHVLAELEAYAGFVTSGSYIVATDGITSDLWDVPRGKAEWGSDNPIEAVRYFLENHPEFILEQPSWPFNESDLQFNITHWPGAWLRRA